MSENNSSRLPAHIGFIMDGNGRWAKKRGLERKFGHKEGARTFRKIVSYCKELGIKYITFYAFSTENWKRPKDEVESIMALFDQYLDEVREYENSLSKGYYTSNYRKNCLPRGFSAEWKS